MCALCAGLFRWTFSRKTFNVRTTNMTLITDIHNRQSYSRGNNIKHSKQTWMAGFRSKMQITHYLYRFKSKTSTTKKIVFENRTDYWCNWTWSSRLQVNHTHLMTRHSSNRNMICSQSMRY